MIVTLCIVLGSLAVGLLTAGIVMGGDVRRDLWRRACRRPR